VCCGALHRHLRTVRGKPDRLPRRHHGLCRRPLLHHLRALSQDASPFYIICIRLYSRSFPRPSTVHTRWSWTCDVPPSQLRSPIFVATAHSLVVSFSTTEYPFPSNMLLRGYDPNNRTSATGQCSATGQVGFRFTGVVWRHRALTPNPEAIFTPHTPRQNETFTPHTQHPPGVSAPCHVWLGALDLPGRRRRQ
jgi:hypothetical protein